MNIDLAKKAMLCRLSISQWTAKKHDKAVSAHVAAEYNADKAAGRYNKALIAKDAIDAVAKVANEARAYHYENTLPWKDDGSRILPAANFQRYSEGLRELRSRFDVAVSDFVSNYPGYIDDARARLNGLFKEEDYPKAWAIREKYSFEVEIDPLPTAPDFRVDLNAAEVDAIRQNVENRLNAGAETARRDLWSRLFDVVSKAAERLSDPGAIFRDSLIENARALVALLPALNLSNDSDLEAARGRVSAALCGYQPQNLRDDKEARKDTAAECNKILEDFAAFMA